MRPPPLSAKEEVCNRSWERKPSLGLIQEPRLNSVTEAPSGLDSGTEDLSGLDGEMRR